MNGVKGSVRRSNTMEIDFTFMDYIIMALFFSIGLNLINLYYNIKYGLVFDKYEDMRL